MGEPASRPDGWPADLPPPGHREFDDAVVAWLFELTPPDYRLHQVLRRYPVALARMARQHVAAELQAAREGYRTARYELRDAVPVHGIEAVLDAYRHEGRRLTVAARGVALVEQALRARQPDSTGSGIRQTNAERANPKPTNPKPTGAIRTSRAGTDGARADQKPANRKRTGRAAQPGGRSAAARDDRPGG